MKINIGKIRITASIVVIAGIIAGLSSLYLQCRKDKPNGPGEAPYQSGALQEIVFDQSYTQLSSPFDTGFEGMSMLTAELRKRGVSVSINSRPLHQLLKNFKGKGHALALGLPATSGEYSDSDIAAVRSFVIGGGGLLAILEHDNAYDNHRFQKKLLGNFGITAYEENAFGPNESPDHNMWPRSTSHFLGIGNIKMFYAASLRLTDGAEPLSIVDNPLLKNRAINGAVNKRHAGTVVVLGDYEILWNMTPGSGIRYGNNLTFILNIVNLLLGNERAVPITRPEISEYGALHEGSNPRGVIYISTQGGALAPDRSISGLYRFAEKLHDAGYGISVGDTPDSNGDYRCIVIACPVSAVDADIVSAGRSKIIIAADGQTDIYESGPEMKNFISAIQKGFNIRYDPREYEYPLNSLAVPLGFRFVSATVLSENADRQFEVASSWLDNGHKFMIRRGSVIEAVRDGFTGTVRVIAQSGEDGWAEKNLMAPIIKIGYAERYKPGTSRKEKCPVAVASERAFALSDVELLTNQFIDTAEGEELFARILEWLDGGKNNQL